MHESENLRKSMCIEKKNTSITTFIIYGMCVRNERIAHGISMLFAMFGRRASSQRTAINASNKLKTFFHVIKLSVRMNNEPTAYVVFTRFVSIAKFVDVCAQPIPSLKMHIFSISNIKLIWEFWILINCFQSPCFIPLFSCRNVVMNVACDSSGS